MSVTKDTMYDYETFGCTIYYGIFIVLYYYVFDTGNTYFSSLTRMKVDNKNEYDEIL